MILERSNKTIIAAFGAILVLLGSTLSQAAVPKVIQLWGMPEQDSFEGWIRVLEEYDEAHPEITILRGSPGGNIPVGIDPQKLMTSVVAGTPADLIWADRFQLASWAARGVFMPLDELYARDNIDRQDFYPACLNECVYQGKTYGLPWDTDSRALWVNMDLLAKGGYSAPPKDWDELAEMAEKLTIRTQDGKYKQVGFAPMFGNSWLYLYGWLNGGEFMSADGRKVTLNDPKIVEALEWMTRVYDRIGGAKALEDFKAAMQAEGASDPFRAGRIAMWLTENSGLDYVAKYTPNLNMKVFPPPPPRGRKSLSWSGGFAWSIPTGATNVEEAWQLSRYLASPEGWKRYGHYQTIANARRSRELGLKESYYVPRLSCSRSINTMQSAEMSASLPKVVAEAFRAHVDLLENCRFRPVTPIGQMLWDEQSRATNNVIFDAQSAQSALDTSNRAIQANLDKYYSPRADPIVPLGRVFAIVYGAVLAICAGIWLLAARRWEWTSRSRVEARAGLLFAAPWLFGFVVLMLGPVIASGLMSLMEYDVLTPARWVGLRNYWNLAGVRTDLAGGLAAADPLFWKSLMNTASVAAVGVPLSIALSLGLALLVNQEVAGVRIYRTLLYVPVVVPIVAASVLWLWLLNSEAGLSGAILSPILAKLGLPSISFFADPRYMRTGVILLILWSSGGSMIIWLAGLKGIPRTYYEAAAMDGAGPLQQFFRITLPMLSPYMFFNLIMGFIGWLQIFVQPYVFIVPPGYGPGDAMLYYMIYLFAQGFQYFNMGAACAMAWIIFLIVALLTWIQFRIAPRWVSYDV